MKNIKPLLLAFVTTLIAVAVFQAIILYTLLNKLEALSVYEHGVTDHLVRNVATLKYDIMQIQQFISDSAATQAPDGIAEAKKAEQDAQKNITELTKLAPEMMGVAQSLSQQVLQLHTTGVKMVAAYGESRDAGIQMMRAPKDGFDARSESAQSLVDQLQVQVNALQKNTATEVDAKTNAIAWVSLSLALVLVVVALVGGFLIYRNIMKILGGEPALGYEAAQHLEDGDLTYIVRVQDGDKASLLASLARMRGRWTDVISGLNGQSMLLSGGASQLMEQAGNLASSSDEESANAHRISANVEELSVTMAHMATQATGAFGQVAATGEAAMRTTRVLQEVTDEIVSVEQSVALSAERIEQLHLQMAEINSIVTTIREVANQTNLLALNAAIEAARAGEAGRGFAVVADEVRKLADRTTGSAKSIGDMIEGVGQMTNEIVQAIEQSVSRVGSGVALIATAQTEMAQVLASSIDASKDMAQIHDALDEISRNTEDIARAVEQVASSSSNNAESAKMLSATSANINQVADALRSDTAYFKLSKPGDDMTLF
ncbi:MAG: methyl-accepting chemotaxis protein [Deefgea sp.]